MALKQLPNNLEAEESVLGACFLSQNALQTAVENLEETDFFDNKNAKIFKALQNLVEQKIPVDLTTVTSELTKQNWLNEVGGVTYLTEVIQFVPTAANIEYYIKEVLDSALLRRLIETATDIATSGYEAKNSVNDILDSAEKKILTIAKNRKTSEFKSIQDVLVKTQADLEKLADLKGEITGIATGWYDLDKITAGLHENELIIVAARPGMGKTAFALNLATYVTTHTEKTVAVFNLEMGAEQLANRILSSLGQIEGYKLRTGRMLNSDWKRFNEAASQLSHANLYIDDTPGISIGEIRAKCRRLSSSSDGLDLVIIDYLQLISGGRNYGSNRQQEVADISRSLKTLAMELHIPIIALAQLSRSVEGREDKRPMLSDLRESGSIEQDADLVGFLYREDYYSKEAKKDANSMSEFIIAKHRNGPQATIPLLFKKDTSTFLNMTREQEEE
ncbi:MAG TPA: replicative DNA helicase [Candidatus Onthousia faecigallinarum]|nr:replicative DNA helicase [Candidatus Onthousia faecigallinarum]